LDALGEIHLITALQGWATDMLQGIPNGMTCGETLQALKTVSRTQRVGEVLQEFATTIERVASRAFPSLPEDHIRMEAGKSFVNSVEDPHIKFYLLLGGEKTLSGALRQTVTVPNFMKLMIVKTYECFVKEKLNRFVMLSNV
jgi:hypothetical protein